MPAAVEYIPPTEKTREDLLGLNQQEIRLRSDSFKRAENYYHGEHDKVIYIEDGEPDDNIVINMVKQVVDRTQSFLFPSLPQISLTETADTPEEKFINQAFEYNGGTIVLSNMSYNGSLSGHVFSKIVPPKPGQMFPRIVNLNPTMVTVFWQADDIQNVLWYSIRWEVGKTQYMQDIIQGDEKWFIRTFKRDEGHLWEEYGAEAIWDFPLSPIVDWQHLPNVNRFYGQPDVSAELMSLNDQINRVASMVNRILRIHAFPRTIGIGLDPGEIIKTEIDGFWATPNTDANIFNLEMQSDLASSHNFLTMLVDTFLAQARVVIMRGTVRDFQRVTNTGIRAVFLDMIAKNALLRWSYGRGIQEISRRMLMIDGKDFSVLPQIVWSDPLPEDDTETVNALAIERTLGIVSLQDAIKERGRNANDQFAKIKREMADEDLVTFYGGSGNARLIKQDTNQG